MWDVIVVGGGFAGIHAAHTLEAQLPGARILVLEGADRLGGRARSVAVADGHALDLGAHYFGVRHRRVTDLARRLVGEAGIYSHIPCYGGDPACRTWLEGQWRVTTRSASYLNIQGLSRAVSWEHRVRIFESLLRYLELEARIDRERPWASPGAAALDAMTVEQWIASQRLPKWIHEMWTLAVLNIMSVWPRQLSLLYWLWYNATNDGFLKVADDYVDGPQEFCVTIGMQGLLERHAAELRGPVRLATKVAAIDRGAPDRVVVRTEHGETLVARRVIVAATPAACRRIEFTPALSPERELLHAQPVGHAAKAVLVYRGPWWHDARGVHFNVFSAGAEAEGIEWVLDTSHPDGRQHSLSAFVSDRLIDRAGPDPEARRRAVVAAMVELTGDPRAAEATAVHVHDWREQPLVGGGPNTCFGPGVLTRVGEALHRPEGARLWFTSSEHATEYTGYLEGALAAGERCGRAVARALAEELTIAARIEAAPPASGPRPLQRAGVRLLQGLMLPARLAADAARAVRGSEARL